MNLMTLRMARRLVPLMLAACVCLAAVSLAAQLRRPQPGPETFAQLIERLSEPGGYFDTDNLISNEKSYLHAFPRLEQDRVRGGVYIGVGPDQNFSYIAGIRPTVAFIIDIRRDNLLLHLLFKALFAESSTRLEYLCLLTGRAPPEDLEEWSEATIDRIVRYIDSNEAGGLVRLQARLRETIRGFGLPLSTEDLETIESYHARFAAAGLSLQFKTFGRPVQSYNPTFRDLLLETDRSGQQRSYLASEEAFEFVRELQLRDRVVPVVGDLAGEHALATIGEWMQERGERLSAFYASNVEDYLFRSRRITQYVENLEGLPRDRRSVVIRSVFGRLARPHAMEDYYTATLVQTADELLAGFAAGDYRSYYELIGR